MATIIQEFHKAVVIATSAKNQDVINFGFRELTDAINFVGHQITEEAEKMDAIKDALDEGITLEDGSSLRIYDIESYLDLYESEDDEDDDV